MIVFIILVRSNTLSVATLVYYIMTEFTPLVNSFMIKFNKILILIEFNYIGAFDYNFCNEAFDCDRFYYTNTYPWDYLASKIALKQMFWT